MKHITLESYKKILFLGDSITQSAQYINYIDTYFEIYFKDRKPMIINLGLSSETTSGLSEDHHPFPRPCVFQRVDKTLEIIKPDLVIACYGINDGIYHPFGEERFESYKEGIKKLAKVVRESGSDIVFLTPPPFDSHMVNAEKLQGIEGSDYGFIKPYRDYDEVMSKYGKWLVEENLGIGVIDIYTPTFNDIRSKRLEDQAYHSGDGIHVNERGHFIFAKTILKELFNISINRMPVYVENPKESELYQLIEKKNRVISHTILDYVGHGNEWLVLESIGIERLDSKVKELEGQIRELLIRQQPDKEVAEKDFKGYRSYEFYVEGRECIVVEPKVSKEGNPWVWRTEFFDAFSYADMALLRDGWHIAYCNVGSMYGSAEAVEIMKKFYSIVRNQFQLGEKADLFGFSRGGLYAVQYASQNIWHIRSIYLDAPVVDMCSWPGGLYNGVGAPREWKECLACYAIKEEEAVERFKEIRETAMNALIESEIPVILVAGDVDEVVPYEENGELLVKAYHIKEKKIKVIIKPNIGHHPHSLEEPSEIVDFIKNLR